MDTFLPVTLLAILAVIALILIGFVDLIRLLFSRKKSNKKSSQYVHEAGDDQTTDDDEDDDEGFYSFKVTIFDSTGNVIKEEEIKCQDYEYDEDNYVFYFLDENEKNHYIYVKGNFIVHVDEL